MCSCESNLFLFPCILILLRSKENLKLQRAATTMRARVDACCDVGPQRREKRDMSRHKVWWELKGFYTILYKVLSNKVWSPWFGFAKKLEVEL